VGAGHSANGWTGGNVMMDIIDVFAVFLLKC